MVAMIGRGVYSFAEAAKLTGLKTGRVWEWFRGRGSPRQPVLKGDYAPVDNDYAISFYDLIDVFVAGQLREHGVSLQTIRKVYKRLEDDLRTSHPFCRRELLSDGKTVFTRGLDAEGQEEVNEALTRQKVFPEIILPFLQTIDYDELKLLAQKWRIADMVVIDPAICFGKPIVEKAGVPTAILAAAYEANDEDENVVAQWYNVDSTHVLAAVKFERKMAA